MSTLTKFAIYLIVALLTFTVACSVSAAAGASVQIGKEEIEMGKEAAADLQKGQTFVQDDAINARVQHIGEAVAAIANSLESDASYGDATITPFEYTFKVIDDDEINAFSIPGGHIYVHKGLVDLCESDHELAGVLAHEIAHASHHHLVYLLRQQSRLDGKAALLLLAGLLGDLRSQDMSNVMMGAQFYKTARISEYTQKAEWDADHTAIIYTMKAGYNPVGMLTFLERLAERPDPVDWGILQTHPLMSNRVAAVKDALGTLGIEINRRVVTTSYTAMVKKEELDNGQAFTVRIGDRMICMVTEESRAQRLADQINTLLDSGLHVCDLKCDGVLVIARGDKIIEINSADAALAGRSISELTFEANDALHRVLFKDMIRDLPR